MDEGQWLLWTQTVSGSLAGLASYVACTADPSACGNAAYEYVWFPISLEF